MASRSRARRIGAELRELRDSTGMRLVDLGMQIGLSKSTVQRIEKGEKLPTERELMLIMGALGVTVERQDALLGMVDEAQRPNWLAVGVHGLPEQLTTLIDYETTATRVTDVGLVLVPGLLQTYEYTRALLIGGGVPAGEVDTRVRIRLGRQEILDRDDPVELHAFIDESVLLRPIGGAKVAIDQLKHITKASRKPNVTVQVIPLSLGAHPAIDGSYVLMEFALEPPVVHLEQHRSGAFLDEPPDAEAYLELTQNLRTKALSPTESAGLVSECIAKLEGNK